jgi:hypothetical protein
MAAALALLDLKDRRDLYLYDTFEGMTPPTETDVDYKGTSASALLANEARTEDSIWWAYAPLDAVRAAMTSTGYPEDRIHFVKGPVEETIPAHAADSIALLRLDTDWYQSTRHELEHLYPRLVPGGVLIIDDYGHHMGCKKAVDEYFADAPVLLHRIDYSGRMVVKVPK